MASSDQQRPQQPPPRPAPAGAAAGPAPTPGAAPAKSAAAPGEAKAAPPMAWPGNVPSTEQVIGLLRGFAPPPEGMASARKLQEGLTQPERDALRLPGMETLRDGVVLRWRLAAAMDLAPAPGGATDKDALNVLLAEVDRVLDALRAADAQAPEVALAIDKTWEALATDAVKLSERLNAPPAPEPAPPTPRRTGERPAVTGKVTFTPVDPSAEAGPQRRSRALYIVMGVAFLAAGAYHATGLLKPPPPDPTVPGAPAGLMVVHDPQTGLMRVIVSSGRPANPEQQAWLKQQQAAKGLQLKELGPGSYALLPAPAPATPPKVAGSGQP